MRQSKNLVHDAPCLGLGVGGAQAFADGADGLEVEHVGELPGTARRVALDGVRERVHARERREALRHR